MTDPLDVDIDQEIKAFLAAHDPRATPFVELRRAQFDAGLAWVGNPVGSGGLGADPNHQVVIDGALAAAGAPPYPTPYLVGVELVAPTISAFGTAGKRERWPPDLFTCEDMWCQLFSEPGAGSDLASLATRAVRDGDTWVVDGQKVWTTMAHASQWGLLLARTDPGAVKHRGITMFCADMTSPGIDVRPLRQITGDAEYNEVYLSDVRVPDAHRLGEVDQGWMVAMSTLTSERATGDSFIGTRAQGPLADALALWRGSGVAHRNPGLRDELIRCWIQNEVTFLTHERALASSDRGAPGPEVSIGKLSGSFTQQWTYDLCSRIPGASALLIDDYAMVQRTELVQLRNDGDLNKALMASLATSIGGGTTNINKNVIAERVLGLPAEPRADKGMPWNESPRS